MKRIDFSKILLGAVLVAMVAFGIMSQVTTFYYHGLGEEVYTEDSTSVELVQESQELLYGLPVDSFTIVKGKIDFGETFALLMQQHQLDYQVVHTLATEHKDVLDIGRLRQGKPYVIFKVLEDSIEKPKYFVYQSSLLTYYVIDLGDSLGISKFTKDVTLAENQVSGVISSSLYEAMLENGGSIELAMKLSDIYAWTIDFFRLQKGDYFKLIYDEQFIDDTTSVGIEKIKGAVFGRGEVPFYAFYFSPDSLDREYYDENGENLRKAFLKAPLKFSRISSRYNPRRFHPVLKRVKPHLGTDYAAPTGTPIMSTADGTVIAAAYTKGNGNYVKVRHNATYTTQYLHMSKFAKGIRQGKVVRQGDVIGYVGSTGLATGPHVCYRFWKNGKQVDPYRQDLPAAEPIAEEYQEEFIEYKDSLRILIDHIPLAGDFPEA